MSSLKQLPKFIFVLLAVLIAIYALSFYWHPTTPFSVRYQTLNPLGAYSHFVGAGFALLLGGLQVFAQVGSRRHKLLGYGYCCAVIVGATGGCYLAFNAYLGWITGLGLLLADALWISTTLIAVQQARRGRIRNHRQWILRSMALTGAGISLRLLLPLLSIFLPFNTSYIIVAWLSWIGNLAFIELYLYATSPRTSFKPQLLKGV